MLRSARFETPLDLRAHVPGEWVVLSLLQYRSANGRLYRVPPRFITDLASLPGIVQPAIDRNGKSRRPAVLHDFLYCLHQDTREQADALFLEALQAEGIGWATRHVMWLAVRAWGWRYWNKRDGMTEEDFADV